MQFYVNISKQLQITVSLRTETVFVFTWDFDEVLNLPPNFVSVYQTALKFKINSSFISVCHVNRHGGHTSKWTEISLRTEIWLQSEISDLPNVNAALVKCHHQRITPNCFSCLFRKVEIFFFWVIISVKLQNSGFPCERHVTGKIFSKNEKNVVRFSQKTLTRKLIFLCVFWDI